MKSLDITTFSWRVRNFIYRLRESRVSPRGGNLYPFTPIFPLVPGRGDFLYVTAYMYSYHGTVAG
jgi:hypothetical protein